MSASVTHLRLRELPLLARLGLTGALLAVALGLWASAVHLVNHHSKNDGDPESLTVLDLRGAYHGVEVPSPLRAVVAGESFGHPNLSLPDADRTELLDWLAGDDLLATYDAIDLGDRAPAELLAVNCGLCHSSSDGAAAGGGLALDYWEDLTPLLSDKRITPTPRDIVVTSLHTHATSMALLVLAVGGLALATRFPRWLAALPLGLGGVALIADTASWLIAREVEAFVFVIAGAGAGYMGSLGLGVLLALAECWLPRRTAAP